MKKHMTPTFETAGIDEILPKAQAFKDKNYAYVQMCATTLDESCELLYSFYDPSYGNDSLTGFVVNVPDGAKVPSITGLFPAAFVFENEAHDLFGISIEGINIDFEGNFYTVAVEYPMNPRAAQQPTEQAEEGGNE